MALEGWIGFVELRQLPGENHSIALDGKGAFTWIACLAYDEASYKKRVAEVEAEYGLFVVDVEQAMSYTRVEEIGIVDDELADISERTSQNEKYCIFGIFHSYRHDN